jgi:hypothetical protein
LQKPGHIDRLILVLADFQFGGLTHMLIFVSFETRLEQADEGSLYFGDVGVGSMRFTKPFLISAFIEKSLCAGYRELIWFGLTLTFCQATARSPGSARMRNIDCSACNTLHQLWNPSLQISALRRSRWEWSMAYSIARSMSKVTPLSHGEHAMPSL